jgi:hypothetical protein
MVWMVGVARSEQNKLPIFMSYNPFLSTPTHHGQPKWIFSVLVALKIKICTRRRGALEHVSIIRIFNPRIFHMLFLMSKNGLCM